MKILLIPFRVPESFQMGTGRQENKHEITKIAYVMKITVQTIREIHSFNPCHAE